MSTFAGLNTALAGLNAARLGLEVTGQNMTNVSTAGYTRQRVDTSTIGAPTQVSGYLNALRAGQGVKVDQIERLGDTFLEARVRSAATSAGFTSTRAEAMLAVEDILGGTGEGSLSSTLQGFWSAWADLSNQPSEVAPAGVVIEQAQVLSDQIAGAYHHMEDQWTASRDRLTAQVDQLNTAASAVAELNAQVRVGLAAGANVNHLLDERAQLAANIAELAGGNVSHNEDGTIDVLVAGNPLVSGDTANRLQVVGATNISQLPGQVAGVQWANRPGVSANLNGGKIAGSVSILAPASSGGPIATSAQALNEVATTLASTVNAIHATGATTDGTTGLDFFALDPSSPAALGLSVLPTSGDEIATAAPGQGAYDRSIADAIAQLAEASGGADEIWTRHVSRVAVDTSTALSQANLADGALGAATGAQLALTSVSMDEETLNLMTYQRAYQGAARVMTAVDEMLETLINRTGRVGL